MGGLSSPIPSFPCQDPYPNNQQLGSVCSSSRLGLTATTPTGNYNLELSWHASISLHLRVALGYIFNVNGKIQVKREALLSPVSLVGPGLLSSYFFLQRIFLAVGICLASFSSFYGRRLLFIGSTCIWLPTRIGHSSTTHSELAHVHCSPRWWTSVFYVAYRESWSI